jgi:hypothetical protein
MLHLGRASILAHSSKNEIKEDIEAGKNSLIKHMEELGTDASRCVVVAATHQHNWVRKLGLTQKNYLDELKSGKIFSGILILYRLYQVEDAILYITSTKYVRYGRISKIDAPGYYVGTGENIINSNKAK